MRAGVKYLRLIIGVLAGRDISEIAFYIERHPVRSCSASEGQLLLYRRSHRVQHAPDVHEWDTAAALPNFTLVRSPADSMQQPGLSGRMIWDAGGDDLARFDISYLHSPEAGHVVHDTAAHALDCIGSEDSGIRSNAGDSVTAGIDQIEIMAAPVSRLGLLKNRPGQGKQSVVRSIRKIHPANDVASFCIQDVDVVGRTAFPRRNIQQPSV